MYERGSCLSMFWALLILKTSTASILWVSDPVLPNETLIVQGHGLGSIQSVTMSSINPPSTPFNVPITNVGDSGFHVLIPENFIPGNAFELQLGNQSMEEKSGIDPYIVNAPQVQWVLGNAGHESTQSGWIRIFGKCLALDRGHDKHTKRTRQRKSAVVLRQQLRQAVDTSRPYDEIARIIKDLKQLETTDSQATGGPRLHLQANDGTRLVLTPTNFSDFSAHFDLPPNIGSGTYGLSVSSPPAGGPDRTFLIEWFKSKENPRASEWTIVPTQIVRPSRVYVNTDGIGLDYVRGVPRNATEAIDRALGEERAIHSCKGTRMFEYVQKLNF